MEEIKAEDVKEGEKKRMKRRRVRFELIFLIMIELHCVTTHQILLLYQYYSLPSPNDNTHPPWVCKDGKIVPTILQALVMPQWGGYRGNSRIWSKSQCQLYQKIFQSILGTNFLLARNCIKRLQENVKMPLRKVADFCSNRLNVEMSWKMGCNGYFLQLVGSYDDDVIMTW